MINYEIDKIMTIWYGINHHDLKMDKIYIINKQENKTQHNYSAKKW